jgi:uncharacterized RDD family membrane protein YckC/Tfp pilus assembly protein PilE
MKPATTTPRRPLPDHRSQPYLHAGFWRRVAAWFIDALILGAVQSMLVVFSGTWLLVPWALLDDGHGNAMARLFDAGLQPFGIVLAWLYFALCEASRWQATPGKLALGLQVTDECGNRIGFGRATGRFFGKFVSTLILCVGFLLAGWTARKQALHDLMAGCCVVRKHGLTAWRNEQAVSPETETTWTASHGVPPQTSMPGWAIALVALGVGLFLVLPLAGFLAAIAIPAYQSHVLRTQVAQGVDMTARARSLVAEYINKRGALPGSNDALGLPKPDAIRARYVSSVRVAGGKVIVTYGNQANPLIRDGHVVISPVGNAAILHWHCSSPDIRDSYLPESCR